MISDKPTLIHDNCMNISKNITTHATIDCKWLDVQILLKSLFMRAKLFNKYDYNDNDWAYNNDYSTKQPVFSINK